MGKKGKRTGKAGSAVAKQGPGKARRERAAAIKDFEKRLDALIETLEAELQGKDMFPPLDEQKREECPLCLKPLPLVSAAADTTGMFYCCGQLVCMACKDAWDETARTKFAPCPLCRSDPPADVEEQIGRLKRRADANDAKVVYELSKLYLVGCLDQEKVYLKPDSIKSFELKLRAAELQNSQSLYSLGIFFLQEPSERDAEEVDGLDGLQKDKHRGIHLLEYAARMGNAFAHQQLGGLYKEGEEIIGRQDFEEIIGRHDYDLSLKHFTYAARCGYGDSLEMLRDFTREERVSVDEFVEIEKACKEANGQDDEESTASDDE